MLRAPRFLNPSLCSSHCTLLFVISKLHVMWVKKALPWGNLLKQWAKRRLTNKNNRQKSELICFKVKIFGPKKMLGWLRHWGRGVARSGQSTPAVSQQEFRESQFCQLAAKTFRHTFSCCTKCVGLADQSNIRRDADSNRKRLLIACQEPETLLSWASAEIFSGMGQRQHFAEPCQVADESDDAMQMYVHETLYVSILLHHKENALYFDSSQKNALR